jgi:hypothetical protein
MFRVTPSIVSAVSSFAAKRRQTMNHFSASPLSSNRQHLRERLHITIMDEKTSLISA